MAGAAKPIIVENDAGDRLQLVGKQWVPMDKSAVVGGPTLANVDKTKINSLQDESAQANEVQTQYNRARTALHDLNPGPWRGRLLEAAIPEDNGGIMDTIGGAVLGGPLRATGYLSPTDIDNFQKVRGIQSEAVQQKQTLQKGVQTEGDAARIMLSDISPTKTLDTNNAIMDAGQQKIDRQKGRADFYAKWANGFGSLQAVDQQGRSVEKAYQDAMTNGGFQQPNAAAPAEAPKQFVFDPATGEIKPK